MIGTVAFLVAFAFIAIHYMSARRLLAQLASIDPDYFAYLGGPGGVSARNSRALVALLLDERIPKDFYPTDFRRRLSIVRWMALLTPLVLIAAFVLSAWFA